MSYPGLADQPWRSLSGLGPCGDMMLKKINEIKTFITEYKNVIRPNNKF